MTQVVDYSQTSEDHRSLLVLVRHTGSHLHAECFNRIYERISRVNCVRVQGQNREICVRFRRNYSVEANSWGDFQGHRKVLGLITVGKCSDHRQFQELLASYKRQKEDYGSTVINSRLIVFGLNSDGSPLVNDSPAEGNQGSDAGDANAESQGNSAESESSHIDNDKTGSDDGHQSPGSKARSPPLPSNLALSALPSSRSSSPSPSSPTSQAASRDRSGHVTPSEGQPESLKLNAQQDNNNRSKLSANGVALTGRSSPNTMRASSPKLSRSQIDRGSKQAPNLTKESGGSEVVFYPSLDSCPDVEERIKDFVTSLYFVLEGKRLDRSFERNDKGMPLCAPFEKKDFVGVDTEAK